MCGSALAGLGSADGLVSRVVGRVSVVVGASVVVAQAVTSSTRATPPNHLITRPSSRTVDWSIRIGAEARRGPLPIWNLNQEPVAAVEVRRLRSCRGRGIEKDFGQIWSLGGCRKIKGRRADRLFCARFPIHFGGFPSTSSSRSPGTGDISPPTSRPRLFCDSHQETVCVQSPRLRRPAHHTGCN